MKISADSMFNFSILNKFNLSVQLKNTGTIFTPKKIFCYYRSVTFLLILHELPLFENFFYAFPGVMTLKSLLVIACIVTYITLRISVLMPQVT